MKLVIKIIAFFMFAGYTTTTVNAQVKPSHKKHKRYAKIREHKEFYENGQLEMVGKSNGCTRIGVWKHYHENGQLYSIVNFGKTGQITGYYAIYNTEGKLLFENNYKGKGIENYKSFYKNGNLYEEGTLKDYRKTGVWSTYYESGKLHDIDVYTANHKLIKHEVYFEDGRKKELVNYNEKGERDGAMLHYDYNDMSHQKGAYKAGKKQGKWFYYWDKDYWNIPYLKAQNKNKSNWDEDSWIEVSFVDGKEEGVKKYYQNNKLQRQENYLQGKREGKFIEIDYTEQGSSYISESGYYSNDLETGTWKYYRNDEERIWLNKVKNYKLGKLDGLYISYYNNSIVDTKGQYSDGEEVGLWKDYYKGGSLYSIGNYKAGYEEGEWRYYSSSANLLVDVVDLFIDTSKNDDTENPDMLSKIGTYKRGEKIGVWKYYKDGKLIKTEHYD